MRWQLFAVLSDDHSQLEWEDGTRLPKDIPHEGISALMHPTLAKSIESKDVVAWNILQKFDESL